MTVENYKLGPLQPGASDPSSKPSIDKLIDINHYLMRRIEQLEEQNQLLFEQAYRIDPKQEKP